MLSAVARWFRLATYADNSDALEAPLEGEDLEQLAQFVADG